MARTIQYGPIGDQYVFPADDITYKHMRSLFPNGTYKQDVADALKVAPDQYIKRAYVLPYATDEQKQKVEDLLLAWRKGFMDVYPYAFQGYSANQASFFQRLGRERYGWPRGLLRLGPQGSAGRGARRRTLRARQGRPRPLGRREYH